LYFNIPERIRIIEPDEFLTIDATTSTEMKIKGSVFIGTLLPVPDKRSADEKIGEFRQRYYDAAHNCFAYRINLDDFRYYDDGEPSGTAGRPILSMIDKYELMQVLLVVTRYFGGTKLGTGGLARAYGECAEMVIRTAVIKRKLNYITVQASYSFALINKVQLAVKRHNGQIREDATAEGMNASIRIPPSRLERLKNELINVTAGHIKFTQNIKN
jgi:uncharacterized YigZ family protein